MVVGQGVISILSPEFVHRAPDAADLLCRPYPELMVVERTGESWVRR
jgi:hypothetical protein